MQTVIETPSFLAQAERLGLDEADRLSIVSYIAENPDAGEVMVGTGGARKLRFAGRGKGKSGGYRVISFYAAADIPVFLLDIYGKGDKANLSKAERNELAAILGTLAETYRNGARAKVVTMKGKPK